MSFIKATKYGTGLGKIYLTTFNDELIASYDNDKTGKEIEQFVNGINTKGVKQEVEITCSNEDCNNVYTAPINFDPVNFFTGS